jgi:hypothetical protein
MVKHLRGVKSLPPESRINARFDGAFGRPGGPKSAADCGFHVLVKTGQSPLTDTRDGVDGPAG